MLSLHIRFFFSISNSTLLFEQSSHLLTLIVCVCKPNLLTFVVVFSLTSYVERMSSCCLLFSCVCVGVFCFFFVSGLLALVLFYFFAHSTTPACLTSCFLFLFFFIIIFLLFLSVDFNQDLLC